MSRLLRSLQKVPTKDETRCSIEEIKPRQHQPEWRDELAELLHC